MLKHKVKTKLMLTLLPLKSFFSLNKKIKAILFLFLSVTTFASLTACQSTNEFVSPKLNSKKIDDSQNNLANKNSNNLKDSKEKSTKTPPHTPTLKPESVILTLLTNSFEQLTKKINELNIDDQTKKQKLKLLTQNVNHIRESIEKNDISENQIKLSINSLDNILKVESKTKSESSKLTKENNICHNSIDKFIKNTKSADNTDSDDQTIPEFKNGKRIVEDQYKYDFPQKLHNFFTSKYGSEKLAITNHNLKKQKQFTPWDGLNHPKYSLELEKLAREVDQPLPKNAYYRAMTTPDPKNKDKLFIPTFQRIPDIAPISFYTKGIHKGEIDENKSGPNHYGLPRVIVNNTYKDLIDNVVSILIGNGHVGTKQVHDKQGVHTEDDYREPGQTPPDIARLRGSFNILDYQVKDGQDYPLTWYFTTNAHVARHLRLQNDEGGDGVYGRDTTNYNTHNTAYNTREVSILKLIKEQVQLNKVIPLSNQEPDWQDYYKNIKIDPAKIKLVMIGTNVMGKKVSDYTDQEFWKGVGMVIDFAIVEITFNSEEDAKLITQNWYEKHKNLNKNNDYIITSDANLLDKKQYTNLPKDPFYTLGFPISTPEKYIKEIDYGNVDKTQIQNKLGGSVSVWTNKPSRLFPQKNEIKTNSQQLEQLRKNGGDMNWTRGLRSFMSTPGITDWFIASPYIEEGVLSIEKYNNQTHKFDNDDWYAFSGLGTVLDNMVAGGGMSGSGVYLNDKLYGLIYSSDALSSSTGVINLRSYGKNYKGYYGKYNLPKYDLIYGDGAANGTGDQKKSYFDAMQHMHTKKGQQIRTFLFPNGFGESHRVNVFENKSKLNH